jgi:hypothetical protein
MISEIESYKSWLDTNGYADIQQSLRIYDLIESLRNDRMTLAFLAEFSRGKTELINAMFFSDFKQRLLPHVSRDDVPDGDLLRRGGGAVHVAPADRDAQPPGNRERVKAPACRVDQGQAERDSREIWPRR